MIARLLVILLTLLGCFLTRQLAFDDDEFQHAHMAVLIGRGEVAHRDFFEHHLPLYHMLQAAHMAGAAGPAALMRLRTLSALFFGASLACALALLKRENNQDSPALLLLWALSPIFLIKMLEARPESLALLLYLLCLWLLKPESPRLLWAGVLGSAMVLSSQKFIFPAAALALIVFLDFGWKACIRFCLAALPLPLLFLAYLLLTASLEAAWEQLVILNGSWKEHFSWWMYGSLLWRSSGLLCLLAMMGLLLGQRRALILSGATLLALLLVPIPFRQTWLMLYPALLLGAGRGWQELSALLPEGRFRSVTLTLLCFIGLLPALSNLLQELEYSPQRDLQQMNELAEHTQGPVFDGRGIVFWRDHVGYYPWLHQGLIQMLDHEAYANESIQALIESGYPPFVRDYRTELFPETLLSFLEDQYEPSDLEELWQPGFRLQLSRLMGSGMKLDLPVAGVWQLQFEGGSILLNAEAAEAGSLHTLPAGELQVRGRGFIRKGKLIRVKEQP